MFCSKCGTKNPDDSKFCASCGAVLDEGSSTQARDSSQAHIAQALIIDDLPEIDASSASGVHCPKCKSEKIQVLNETNVRGGYRAGKGCLGYLLFGPLGFLCGALGKKAKITSMNSAMFVCMECGFKFADIEEMIAEREKSAKLSLGVAIGLLIFCILILISDFSVDSLSYFIFPLIFGCKYIVAKSEKEKLISEGYDAPLFLKEKNK